VQQLTTHARGPDDDQYWLKHAAQITEKVCVKSDKDCQRIIYKKHSGMLHCRLTNVYHFHDFNGNIRTNVLNKFAFFSPDSVVYRRMIVDRTA
jgi:hypothetical protein